MPAAPLSAYVRQCHSAIDSSLEKLTCTSQGITEVDIHPAVLAALTTSGPERVRQAAKETVWASEQAAASLPRASSTGLSHSAPLKSRRSAPPPSVQSESEAQAESTAAEGLNVALAFSLHTVLLSRNRMVSLLGVVQFKNVVRLSLLGNAVRRIEDCEPLALLPQLAFLSLEYNPVTTLPHYRAHLLQICSWPNMLAPRFCRLKKLDVEPVTVEEIQRSIRCLQRELALLPELVQRVRLTAFLENVEHRQQLHRELCRRGALVVEQSPSLSIRTIIERCSEIALDAVDITEAAHAVRRLVERELKNHKHRRVANGGKVESNGAACSSGRECGPSDGPPSVTAEGLSSITETSSSFYDASGNGGASCCTIDGVSDVLMADLSWSTSSLQHAELNVAAHTTCEEWSTDVFRRAIATMDVRLCTLLLRIARGLGQALTSAEVDALFRDWLHTASHHVSFSANDVDVTGRRVTPKRTVVVGSKGRTTASVPSAKCVAPAMSRREDAIVTAPLQRSPALSSITHSDDDDSGGGGVMSSASDADPTEDDDEVETEKKPVLRRNAAQAVSAQSPVSRAHPIASTQTSSSSSASSSSQHSARETVSEVRPRSTAPVAMQPPHVTVALPTTTEVPHVQTFPISGNEANAAPMKDPSLTTPSGCARVHEQYDMQQHTVLNSQLVVLHLRQKRRALQLWKKAMQRRHLERQCMTFVLQKLQQSVTERGPFWCTDCVTVPLALSSLPYTERKRLFFERWRSCREDHQAARSFAAHQVVQRWRRRLAWAVQEKHLHAQGAARCLSRTFTLWKRQAVARAEQRCEEARQRVRDGLADRGSHTSSVNNPSIASCASGSALYEALRGARGSATRLGGSFQQGQMTFSFRPPKLVEQASSCEATPIAHTTADLSDEITPSMGPTESPVADGVENRETGSPSPRFSASPEICTSGGLSWYTEIGRSPRFEASLVYGLQPPPPLTRAPATRSTGAVRFTPTPVSVQQRKESVPNESAGDADSYITFEGGDGTSEAPRNPRSRSPQSPCVVRGGAILFNSPTPMGVKESTANKATKPQTSPERGVCEEEMETMAQRADVLEADRAILVQRLVHLQLALEEERIIREQAESKNALLRTSIAQCEQREAALSASEQLSAAEALRLRHAVEALRQERREWVEDLLLH